MSKVLIIGAGREGKGFLGETFSADGWDVSFLDKDPKVISNLQNGAYDVKLYEPEGVRTHTVTGYHAYLADENYCCMEDALEASIFAIATYPEDIPDVANYLGKIIEERAKVCPQNKLSILACTNKNHYIDDVCSCFRQALQTEEARAWFDSNAVVRDCIVRRSTNAESSHALSLVSTVCMTLLVQQPIFADISDLRWVELCDDIENLKEIKLYTYNGPHATCAYCGYQKGYSTILQASADPEIANLMHQVLVEAIPALSKEFGVAEDKIWDFCTFPKMKEEMDDAISRVAYDPIRKLGRYDRLIGNAEFCMKYGIIPEALTTAAACALAYDEPKDPNAQKLQALIKEKGIDFAAEQICGLPSNGKTMSMVISKYKNIKGKSM